MYTHKYTHAHIDTHMHAHAHIHTELLLMEHKFCTYIFVSRYLVLQVHGSPTKRYRKLLECISYLVKKAFIYFNDMANWNQFLYYTIPGSNITFLYTYTYCIFFCTSEFRSYKTYSGVYVLLLEPQFKRSGAVLLVFLEQCDLLVDRQALRFYL